MNKVHITSLGCPKNSVDSEKLILSFSARGFTPVGTVELADILLVNTCGFIQAAKEESIQEILKLAQIKGKRKLVVFGCLVQRYKDELMKEIPEIDALWGVGEEQKIIEYCKSIERKKEGQGSRVKGQKIRTQESDFRSQNATPQASYAYLKIAEGCDRKCTFCVIPSIRGKFRSIPHEEILNDARAHIQAGKKELILVAQDITTYGKEGGHTLTMLLKELAALEGNFRIRVLYLYPTTITDELIQTIAAEEKILNYFDIPLQHSEDRILRLMGRQGTRNEYRKLIRKLRREIPGVALRTTFIVGFPSETEEDFHGLIDFIEEIRFDRLGAFTYSHEEGTPAARLKGQVPERVKKRRLDELMKHQAHISYEKNRELVGRRFDTLIDEVDGDVAFGRLYSHAPEIDGMVIIEHVAEKENLLTVGPLHSSSSPLNVGDSVEIEIVDAYDYDLKGKRAQ